MEWLAKGLLAVLDKLAEGATVQAPDGDSVDGKRSGVRMAAADGSSASEWRELAEKLRGVSEETGPLRQLLELELFERGSRIGVLVNEPRLELERLRIEVDGDMLVVSSKQDTRHFYGELLLPHAVDHRRVKQSFRQGVLSLSWPVAGKKAGNPKSPPQ